jgi:outer membrane protein TolC
MPRVDGFAQYEYSNPNQRVFPQTSDWTGTWMAGVRLRWSTDDLFSNDAVARQLEAQRSGIEARARMLRDAVRMEVVSAYVESQNTRSALVAAELGEEAALSDYTHASNLYRVGEATTTDVIEAETELAAAQIRLINGHIDERVARTRLAYATGGNMARIP